MADLLVWDGSCRVGVEEFDQAHQHLFAIGNNLIRAVLDGHALEVIRPVIDELIDYAEQHFRSEEALMRRAGYPGYEAHRAEHHRLMNDVQLFKSRYIAGEVQASEVSLFLIQWIQHHVKETDMAYSGHLQQSVAN